MRHFIVRTVTGRIDPQALVSGLWPSPQWRRMLTYSVVFHICIAMSFILARSFTFSFRKPMRQVAYSVDLVEVDRLTRKKSAISSTQKERKEETKARLKPEPKPKQELKHEEKQPPEPESRPRVKPAVEKKQVPVEEKHVEAPKAAQSTKPEQDTPQEKAAPVVSRSHEEQEPPPQAVSGRAPEPAEIAKAIAPEPSATAGSTVAIRRKVWQNWIEPSRALTPGMHSRVVMCFEIGLDGKFADEPMIFESSSNFALDQSGYRAVLRSVPFPPLPESYSGSSLGVRFGFEYGEEV